MNICSAAVQKRPVYCSADSRGDKDITFLFRLNLVSKTMSAHADVNMRTGGVLRRRSKREIPTACPRHRNHLAGISAIADFELSDRPEIPAQRLEYQVRHNSLQSRVGPKDYCLPTPISY